LRRRLGIGRFGPAVPALPVAAQVPHPITAAPAFDGSIQAFSPGAEVRAREAPVGSQVGRQLETRANLTMAMASPRRVRAPGLHTHKTAVL
jgi:hypothetical protein